MGPVSILQNNAVANKKAEKNQPPPLIRENKAEGGGKEDDNNQDMAPKSTWPMTDEESIPLSGPTPTQKMKNDWRIRQFVPSRQRKHKNPADNLRFLRNGKP